MNDRLPPEPVDPYSAATAANTGTQWLDDMHKVDLSLNGMHDYAKNMATFSDDLRQHWGKLAGRFADPSKQAFGTSGFPEVQFVGQLSGHALAELSTYMGNLVMATQSVSYAAQTIADSYAGTDGWSAVDINAVNYAFAQPNAHKPKGLNIPDYGTFYQAMAKQDAENQAAGGPAPGGDLGTAIGQPVTGPNGELIMTYQAADGTITTVTTVTTNGQTVTTIKNDKHTIRTTTTTSSYPYGTYTTAVTETTDAKDPSKVTKSTSTTSTYSNAGSTIETQTTTDDQGKVTDTRSTTTTYNSDGTTTVTKQGASGDKTSTTYGPNPVVDKHPDDSGEDVMRDTQSAMR